MKLLSIRNGLVLSITLFVAVLLILIAAGTYAYFRKANEELIFNQQFALVSSIAHDLDSNIQSAHKALIAVAEHAPADALDNPAAAQKWLQDRADVSSIFTSVLAILDHTGTLVASYPLSPENHGKSLAYRDYFINTMSSGKPTVSAPFLISTNGHPVIMMTAPLRAPDGSIKAILCGAIDLMEEKGIFRAVKETRVGTSGYLYLYAQDRTMVMHPDNSRIMTQDVKPGANKYFDKALEGFEGSGETINSRGIPFLASFKRLETTGWILAANYQLEEALEPITRFRNYFLLGMFFVLLTAMALAWKLGSGLARPIEGLVEQLNALAKPEADRTQRLDIQRSDELGVLATAFNTLLDTVQRHEKDLEEAHTQVMQSEKLASVGQLAAGIAHEINNPIGFIKSNLGSLKGQVENLLKVLDSYKMAEPVLADYADLLASIERAKSAADFEYLQEDIVNLIKESLDGVIRVKKIVENLKDFSRIDTAEWQYANLEVGLENTLSIVWNEIENKAEVEKEYAGLPQIECIISQINQVFLSLLLNAAQAIEVRGTITLRTGYDEHNVWVDIADTGTGIHPEHLGKIFDPFFTTKPVGKGTGLGLSLSYGIIKRHHGRLEVRSELGKGTRFRVTLPRLPVIADNRSSAGLMQGTVAGPA
jgi:signal transduction histidine kinase